MNKQEMCDKFATQLESWKVNFQRHSTYHIQIQIVHNFYPSKGSYYNSDSGERANYSSFESGDELIKWLSERDTGEAKEESFTVTEILEYLDDCENLVEAIVYFNNQKSI